MNDRENADDRAPSYDLGILVVHGIGDQKQGATLTTWVDAIVDWLEARVHGGTVRRAVLRPPEGPAHVELAVETAPADAAYAARPQNWLFAEGWWASTFEPPSFAELWGWSFVSVPATAAMHANTVMGDAIGRYRRALGGQRLYEAFRLVLMMLLLIVVVMISPLMLGLFTLLFLLGLVASFLPIDALRTAILKAQLISIGTIGDTKRLIDSPTHAGAIKSPVIDGIAWLRGQGCERVVVLAHSQGAAVTYKALVDLGHGLHGPVEPVESLITVGSGLPKVNQLEYLSSREGRRLRLASLLVPGAAVAIASSVRHLVRKDALAGLGVVGIVFLATAAVIASLQLRGRRSAHLAETHAEAAGTSTGRARKTVWGRVRFWQLSTGLAGFVVALLVALPFDQSLVTIVAVLSVTAGLASIALIATDELPPVADTLEHVTDRWVDLYASGDPVPAGPTRTTVSGRPESWRVTNLGSVARDHNAYPFNVDECLSYIGTELANVSNLLRGRERHRVRLHRSERLWRAGWRRLIGTAMGGAAIVFAVTTHGGATDAIARWYASLMAPNGLVDTWWPGDLPGFVPTTMVPDAATVVMTLGYVAIGLGAIQIGNAAWSSWNTAASEVDLEQQRSWGRVDQLVGNLPDDRLPPALDGALSEADHTKREQGPAAPFAVMIGLVVFAWFIALVPQWAWSSWRTLDLTSWTGLGVLVGAISTTLLIGRAVPALIARTNLKRWAMGRDTSRIEGLVAYGDYQLNRLDRPVDALTSFSAACDMAMASGHHHPDALAAKARCLILRAARSRRRAANDFNLTTERQRWQFQAALDEREALALYEQACSRPRLVAPWMRLEYAAQLHRLRGDAATSEIHRQLREARAHDGDDLDILVALVAHRLDDAEDEPPWVDQLASAIGSMEPGSAQRLVPLFTLIAAAGPDHPDRVARTLELRDLLGAGHRALTQDPAPALELLVRDGWPEALAAELHQLAGLLVGRVADLPPPMPVVPGESRGQPTRV